MLKGKGFIGGLITIIVLSFIVFFVFYFFMPEVSERFFGLSIRQEYTDVGTNLTNNEQINSAIEYVDQNNVAEGAVMTANEATIAINDYLSSDEGKEVTAAIQSAAREAGESVADFIRSDEGKALFDNAREFVSTGAGSVSDFFSTGEGKELLEGLGQ